MTGSRQPSEVDGRGRRVALVVSRFNAAVTDDLARGARRALEEAGVGPDDVVVYEVAGAFELAPACRQIIGLIEGFDAVVALGAVIRGETPHFTFISEAAAGALQRLAVDVNVPLAFGVLTADTREQAIERADPGRGDKGGEAARAALEQLALFESLRREGEPSVRGFRVS